MKNKINKVLEAILEDAIVSGEDILEIIEERYSGREAVDIFLGIVANFDDWRIYQALLTNYRDYLLPNEIKRITDSAEDLFDSELLTWLEE